MKVLLVNLLLAVLVVLAFDLATYSLLPAEYTFRFEEYRPRLVPAGAPTVGGRAGYPKHYFVAHRTRGFDIGEKRRGDHWVDGIGYPVWSNSLGCFDKEHASYNRYVYIAGDSYTWGYAPFERTFASVIERMSGLTVLKCGVTHTGQRHQYDKFVEIAARLGKLPRAVFVFYAANDIANDYAYPHSTVIDGWLVDRVSLDENMQLVRHSDEELRQRVEARIRETAQGEEEPKSWPERLKGTVKAYSLTANLLSHAKNQVLRAARVLLTPGSKPAPSLLDLYLLRQELRGRYWHSDNPRAQPNKDALLAFRNFAAANDIPLVVMLIPPKHKFTDTKWYEELRKFLADNAITHVDLAFDFRERGLNWRELYWKNDNHLNSSGHRLVAKIVVARFPRIFESARRSPVARSAGEVNTPIPDH